MARDIVFIKESVGLEKVNKTTRFHCIVELRDNGKAIAKRLIQGCLDVADLEAKAAAWADEIEDAEPIDPEPTDEEKLEAIKTSISGTPVPCKKSVLEIG